MPSWNELIHIINKKSEGKIELFRVHVVMSLVAIQLRMEEMVTSKTPGY